MIRRELKLKIKEYGSVVSGRPLVSNEKQIAYSSYSEPIDILLADLKESILYQMKENTIKENSYDSEYLICVDYSIEDIHK